MHFRPFLLLFIGVRLAAAEPFLWEMRSLPDGTEVTCKVAPGYWFYRDSLSIAVTGKYGRRLLPSAAAASELFQDEFSGPQQLYRAGIHRWRFTGNGPFLATIEFQGCGRTADGSTLCLPPRTVTIGKAPETIPNAPDFTDKLAFLNDFEVVSSQYGGCSVPDFLRFLKPGEGKTGDSGTASRGMLAAILLTLLGGLLLNFTPCVLPMIPVNLAIIGADGSAGAWAGFRRGLCYGVGMALAYGVLGVVTVLAGSGFGQLNSLWYFNGGIGVLFCLLAAGMFGWINWDLSRFRHFSSVRFSGSRELTALLLGAISALLAGACVAPVVIGTLLGAAQLYTRGCRLALVLPFLLGIGMALPWPLAGAGLAKLPKPGTYMIRIKQFLGIVILAAGFYYFHLSWTQLPGRWDEEAEFARLRSAAVQAQKEHRPLLIEFKASWCGNCRAMERGTLAAPEVRKALTCFAVAEFQAEKITAPLTATLLKRYRIPGLPAYLVLRAK